jgi:protein involved in polysaccharide export with SLBB domain
MGNLQVPGGYNLSGLASVFSAVYYAGGPSVDGSLRNVKVVHADATVDTVDFYDYMLYGKKTVDVRLRDGDAVFVSPVGRRAAITGLVKRPAIYELKPGEKLRDLITMAGGLRYEAYERRIHIERIVPFTQRSNYQKPILDLDVSFEDADELISSKYLLEDGDVVSVFSVSGDRENLISITGNVNKPGRYELKKDLTVKDLILEADSLREDTFLEHATIYRVRPDLKKEILSFDLKKALNGEPEHNIRLQRLDSVVVYRESFFRPIHNVSIDGAVRNPGSFQRTEHMTVRDLIILADGVPEGADLHNIEISRVDIETHKRIAQIFHISLTDDYWNSNGQPDFVLEDFDNVSIRRKPEFTLLKTVAVTGEAQFPGIYAIEYEGERLSSLLRRFGGFKSTAYLQGVRFLRQIGAFGITRPSPEIVETQQLDTFALKYNLIKKQRTASKEVPIAIEQILNDTTSLDNITLQDGDSLIVPRDPGVVYVEGQVYIPSSVPYKKGASLEYYLKQAGGLKRDADEDNVVVVLPNNRKWEQGGFLQSDAEILSGSTIIAPLKFEDASRTLDILREWVTIAASTTTLAFIVWQVSR